MHPLPSAKPLQTWQSSLASNNILQFKSSRIDINSNTTANEATKYFLWLSNGEYILNSLWHGIWNQNIGDVGSIFNSQGQRQFLPPHPPINSLASSNILLFKFRRTDINGNTKANEATQHFLWLSNGEYSLSSLWHKYSTLKHVLFIFFLLFIWWMKGWILERYRFLDLPCF